MRSLTKIVLVGGLAGCASSGSPGFSDPGAFDAGDPAPASGSSGSGGSSTGGGSSSGPGTLGGSSTSSGSSSGGIGPSSSSSGSGGSSSSGGGGSSSSSGSSSSGGGSCTYPPGPYGITQGSIVSPSLTWQGYLPGGTAVATLHAADLYDCDKSKGINALLFDQSAAWCGACQQEAQDLEGQMTSAWKAEGVYVVTLLAQDASSNDATTQTASDWRSTYGLTDVAVVADPAFSLLGQGGGLPTNVLVDPRTMKIVSTSEGYGGPDPAVDQLAQKNK